MKQIAAVALFFLTLLLLSGRACAQDSLMVSVPAWDIKYHVISGPDYIKWVENPYDVNEDALIVYEQKYLQAVLVRVGARCFNYLPSREGNRPVLTLSHTGCRTYYYLRGEIEKHLDRQGGPIEKL